MRFYHLQHVPGPSQSEGAEWRTCLITVAANNFLVGGGGGIEKYYQGDMLSLLPSTLWPAFRFISDWGQGDIFVDLILQL
jgi:hypothetical protein